MFPWKQNYLEGLAQKKGIEKARKSNVTEWRSPNDENYNHKILTNCPNNPQMINKVKENPNFLKSSIKMNAIMNETKLVVKPETTKKLAEHATPLSRKIYNI